MRLRDVVPCLTLFLAACGAGENPAVSDGAPPISVAPDIGAIATNIVRSMRVAEGDVVVISGSVRDLELLEDVATEVRKAGGSPLVELNTERMARRSYDDVPERYDTIIGEWNRVVAENVDVAIAVDPNETPDLLAHVPPVRVQARTRATGPWFSAMIQRNMRSLDVGNGLYPTHARAAQYGLTRDELARYFWDAMAVDPATLQAAGEQIRTILAGSQQVRVTHPNGTDLTFQIDPALISINTGALSDADLAAGGVEVIRYVPAGEIYMSIRAGSANGRIVADRYVRQGTVIEGLTIDVANGAITSITAESDIEALLAAYGTEKDGRELLTILDIGLNPAIPATPGSTILNYIPAGMVTIFSGPDFWVGGSNTASFGLSTFLPGTTVTVDGRVIIENGTLRP